MDAPTWGASKLTMVDKIAIATESSISTLKVNVSSQPLGINVPEHSIRDSVKNVFQVVFSEVLFCGYVCYEVKAVQFVKYLQYFRYAHTALAFQHRPQLVVIEVCQFLNPFRKLVQFINACILADM